MRFKNIFPASGAKGERPEGVPQSPGEVSLPAKLLWYGGLNNLIEHLLKKVRVNEKGCWIWIGGKDLGGYGMAYAFGIQWRASRLFYFLWKGILREEDLVCHECDNPPCCNPGHLFLGTAQDNKDDCVRKGRHAWGEGARNGSTKLSSDQVLEIRRDYRRYSKNGYNLYDLARKYEVHAVTIFDIVHRRKWKHI